MNRDKNGILVLDMLDFSCFVLPFASRYLLFRNLHVDYTLFDYKVERIYFLQKSFMYVVKVTKIDTKKKNELIGTQILADKSIIST